MNNFIQSILTEVLHYYTKDILNEGKPTDKILGTFIKDDNTEAKQDLLNVLKADPGYKEGRVIQKQNRQTGEMEDFRTPDMAGDYALWLGNLWKKGKLTGNDSELLNTIHDYLSTYDENKSVLVADGNDEYRLDQQNPSIDKLADIVNNVIPHLNDNQEDIPEENKSTGDPWVDYALGIGPQYEAIHGDTPRQLGVEDHGEKLVYENQDFLIIVPTTYKGSMQLGGSAWLADPEQLKNTAYREYIHNGRIINWPHSMGSYSVLGHLGPGNQVIKGPDENGRESTYIVRNNGWCTQMPTNSSYFNSYRNRHKVNGEPSDLYIIFAKHPKFEFENNVKGNLNMWQIHPESNSFMGPGDNSITFAKIQNYGSLNSVRGVINFLKNDMHKTLNPRWTEGIKEMSFEEALPLILNPQEDLKRICDNVEPIEGSDLTIVSYGDKANILDANRKPFFKAWMYRIYSYLGPYYIVQSDNSARATKNLFNADTKSLIYGHANAPREWFNDIKGNHQGLCVVEMNVAQRDENGNIIQNENGDYVIKTKKNVLNILNGQLIINTGKRNNWFDGVGEMSNGYAPVFFEDDNGNRRYNFVTVDGQVFFDNMTTDELPDKVGNFTNQGFAMIGKQGNYYLISKEDKKIIPNIGLRRIDNQPNIVRDENHRIVSEDIKFLPMFDSDGLISVGFNTNIGGRFNMMDTNGDMVLPMNAEELPIAPIEKYSNYWIIKRRDSQRMIHMNILLPNDNFRPLFTNDVSEWPVNIAPLGNSGNIYVKYANGEEQRINNINSQVNESKISKLYNYNIINEAIRKTLSNMLT